MAFLQELTTSPLQLKPTETIVRCILYLSPPFRRFCYCLLFVSLEQITFKDGTRRKVNRTEEGGFETENLEKYVISICML